MSAPTIRRPSPRTPSGSAHLLTTLLCVRGPPRAAPGRRHRGRLPLSGPCAVAVAIGGLSMVAADVAPEWVSEHVPTGRAAQWRRRSSPRSPTASACPRRASTCCWSPASRRRPDRARPGSQRPRRRDVGRGPHRRHELAAADGGGVIMIGRGPGGRLDLRVELEGSDRQWLTAATVVRGRDLLEVRAHPRRRRSVRLGGRLRRDRAADRPLRGFPGGRGRGPFRTPTWFS